MKDKLAIEAIAKEILAGCWDGGRESGREAWDSNSQEIDKSVYFKEATLYVNIMQSLGYAKLAGQKVPVYDNEFLSAFDAKRAESNFTDVLYDFGVKVIADMLSIDSEGCAYRRVFIGKEKRKCPR